MTATPGPRRPPGRYDEPRALPRPVLIGLAAVLLVGLTAAAWWGYRRSREGQVDVAVTSYRVLSDSAVTISFEVHKPSGRVAVCGAQALDRNGSEVGAVTVRVSGPQERVTVSQQLATDRRAATAIVTGCRLEAESTPSGP